MENPQFVTFQKFNDKALAQELGALLDKNKIEYLFEDASPTLGSSFGESELSKEYIIKLKKEDFPKADELLIHAALDDMDSIDKNHYLFDFTDAELRDVVIKKDEWSPFDFLLAQKLLKERGKEIAENELDSLREKRLEDLAKPESRQTASVAAGYIFAFFGGLVGIFIGWYLSTHKKTLPNGDRVYNYMEADRKHGTRIMMLGLFFFVLWTVIYMFFPFDSSYN